MVHLEHGDQLDPSYKITIPTDMASQGSYLLLGQVTYTYTPSVSFAGFPKPITLSDSILMLPRVSDEVPLS